MNKKNKNNVSKSSLLNPEMQSISLINLKKKKQEQYQLNKLRVTLQKQLKLMLKKDETLMRQSMRKKHQLFQEINKQQKLIQYQNQKQQLNLQRQNKIEQKKIEAQTFRNQNKSNISRAVQRSFQIKRQNAEKAKKTISQWRLQRNLLQRKLLEQKKKLFQETERQKTYSRQSNRKYFEKRHSRIVQNAKKELIRSEKQFYQNKKKIEKMELDILQIRDNSQKKQSLIQKIQEEILNVKNESQSLSRFQSKILSPKHSQLIQQKPVKTNGSSKQAANISSFIKYKRQLSLPIIFTKKNHILK